MSIFSKNKGSITGRNAVDVSDQLLSLAKSGRNFKLASLGKDQSFSPMMYAYIGSGMNVPRVENYLKRFLEGNDGKKLRVTTQRIGAGGPATRVLKALGLPPAAILWAVVGTEKVGVLIHKNAISAGVTLRHLFYDVKDLRRYTRVYEANEYVFYFDPKYFPKLASNAARVSGVAVAAEKSAEKAAGRRAKPANPVFGKRSKRSKSS